MPEDPEKFALFRQIGTFTVPKHYIHATCLATFRKRYRDNFYDYNDNLNDQNFKNPSHQFIPDKTYKVTAYFQTAPGITTSEDALAFLKKQNALLVGAQGLTYVFAQLRYMLPRGYAYVSLDDKVRLWWGLFMPYLYAYVDRDPLGWDIGSWYWSLGKFESPWKDNFVLLCFTEVK